MLTSPSSVTLLSGAPSPLGAAGHGHIELAISRKQSAGRLEGNVRAATGDILLDLCSAELFEIKHLFAIDSDYVQQIVKTSVLKYLYIPRGILGAFQEEW